MARKFFAVVVGIVAGSVFNMALIMVSVAIYAPEGLDFEDPDAMRAYVLGLPVTALLIVLAAHGGGSFVGGAVCALVARQKWIMGALIVGTFFLLGGILNLQRVPDAPMWFAVTDVVLYLPLAILGCATAAAWSGRPGEPSDEPAA